MGDGVERRIKSSFEGVLSTQQSPRSMPKTTSDPSLAAEASLLGASPIPSGADDVTRGGVGAPEWSGHAPGDAGPGRDLGDGLLKDSQMAYAL